MGTSRRTGWRVSGARLMSSDAARHNLAVRLTPLIGRTSEATRARAMLAAERLVTLIGAGGVGKSSLAWRVAADVVDRFEGGVWWVDLATVPSGAPIGSTVLTAIGGALVAGRAAHDAIAGLIGGRLVLLVLDNCEHVVDGCAELTAGLLGRCAALTVLATSQEPLRTDGETTFNVPPLSVDDAIELLFDRAGRARPGFERDEATIEALRRICVRLDGIPLALELAASRLRVVSAPQLADELDRRLAVLTGGARTGLPRHRTLRASIEWSHSLLSDDERRVLRRLAVFVGPFPLDGAEVVGAAVDDRGRAGGFDVVARLVDRSLVTVDDARGASWYRLLESVRAFATEQLDVADEMMAVQRALAQWVARWCETHPGAGNYTDAWLADLRRLEPTIRAALAWSSDHDLVTASRIMAAARPLWTAVDAVDTGDKVLSQLEALDELAWARCVAAIADDRVFVGDFPFLDDVVPRAQAICERDGDQVAVTRCRLARVWMRSLEPDTFVEIAELAMKAGARMEYHVALGLAAIGSALRDARRGRELLGQWRTTAIPEDGRAAEAGECQVAAMVELATSADLARHANWTWRGFELLDATVPMFQRSFVLGLCAECALYRLDVDTLADVVRRADELNLDWEPSAAKVAALRRFGDVAVGRPLPAVDLLSTLSFGVVSAIGVVVLLLDSAEAPLLDGLAAGMPGDVGPLRPLIQGAAAWLRGEATTDELLRQALDADRVLMSALSLVLLADRARQASSMTEAVRLVAAAEAQFEHIGFRWRPGPVGRAITDVHAEAREALGVDAYETAVGEGGRLDLADAIEYCRRAHGSRHRPDHGWASLTPTERRVVALVAEGHANAVIAKRMLVAEATVKTHLVHVFRKLAVTSRAQLAAMAVAEDHVADP